MIRPPLLPLFVALTIANAFTAGRELVGLAQLVAPAAAANVLEDMGPLDDESDPEPDPEPEEPARPSPTLPLPPPLASR